MGNMQCPAEDAALLASVARDICPFPNYSPNPLFADLLFSNSSSHLRNHYTAVQSSLTPVQLEDFTQNLRTTFGREGKVTLGGVGVVALSLAVLFDTLARQARGEWVPESGPIPGLFVKDLRGYYPPHVYTVSEYLRLVPHIANNPTRMRKETERYFRQLMVDDRTVNRDPHLTNDAIVGVNQLFGNVFENSLHVHLLRITNSTVVDNIMKSVSNTEIRGNATHVSKTRKRRLPPPENSVIFNLNCDPDAASKVFLAQVNKANDVQEAYKRCLPSNIPKTWLHFIARLVWLDVINNPKFDINRLKESLVGQKEEDFDLKADALRKWAE
ncbi:hypothetical protein ABVT39_003599 [Epinephelus coioides]